MIREDLIEELTEQKELIDKTIDYLQNHSISKLELLQHLDELNKTPENATAVRSFYYKFFKEGKQEEMEI